MRSVTTEMGLRNEPGNEIEAEKTTLKLGGSDVETKVEGLPLDEKNEA
jgi:hypothetical protein